MGFRTQREDKELAKEKRRLTGFKDELGWLYIHWEKKTTVFIVFRVVYEQD